MDIRYDQELNREQLNAVNTVEGPILIIAGAGSGKTRTITYRIARMLQKGIPQSSLLALTFTNKAAQEMSGRVATLTGNNCRNLTISTFHSFGAKILRSCIHHLGYKANFSIYDQSDKTALIREVARELKLPRDSIDSYTLAGMFSDAKTGRKRLTGELSGYQELFDEYQDHLKTYNAVDFDDLILLPLRLFHEVPEVLADFQDRYRYFMVDEFQDTSRLQYDLIQALAKQSQNLCVVGDDDQSIYSWRGADYSNLLRLENDFPGLKEIKLEQNYRSTATILNAANTLISHNSNRKSKTLWTGSAEGSALTIIYPEDEDQEADFISDKIRSMKQAEGIPFHHVGVLVRTNSLTRVIETTFLRENIPYRVSGGISFFQRKEVKDIISYIRVMVNPDDDVNLLRICNTPRRGIGKQTVQTLRETAEHHGCSIYSALTASVHSDNSGFSERVRKSLEEFLSLIELYREKLFSGKKMAQTLKAMIDHLNYWTYLIMETHGNERKARLKYSTVISFTEILRDYERNPDTLDPNIFDFLNMITLITRDDNQDDEASGKVNLMTIHAAKGLEFDVVFLPGVEETIIPHARALQDGPGGLEEERRLFYVALTRARQKLFLSSCRTRTVLRQRVECLPSPFLEELPGELIQEYEGERTVKQETAHDYFAAIKSRFK